MGRFSQREKQMPGGQLIRRFSLTSLGLIGLMAAVLGWVSAWFLTQSMLEREKTLTAGYVQRVVRERISSEELRAAEKVGADSPALRDVAETLALLPEVVRTKIYDTRGTILWSDVTGLVGKNFYNDSSVRQSLQGNVVVELEQITSTPEHEFEHPRYHELTSINVPIRDDQTGELIAVVELYKDPLFLHALIRQGRFLLWTVILIGAGLLFLGQFGLVVSASRTINRQYSDLQQHANALQATNTRLRETQEQLVKTERLAALGEVTAAVAHGVRNPLGNIRLVTQETREALEPADPIRGPLSDIMTQVDLMEARLRSFLNTAKPFDLSLGPIQLSTLIDTAIGGVRQRLIEHKVEIGVEVEAADSVLHIDSVKVEEALQALLSNSVEAGAHLITIKGALVSQAERQGMRLQIIDDGSGLPAGNASLFKPFFTTKSFGTGLGLYLAKKVIEAHGGTLLLRPHSPCGVEALIELPCCNKKSEEGLT